MKKIPFLLVLILTLAWGYTSWYWYTCNIKSLCDVSSLATQEGAPDDTGAVAEDTLPSSSGSQAQRLSADDVLSGDNTLQDQEVVEAIPETAVSTSGSTDTTAARENLMKTEDTAQLGNLSICDGWFTGPIAFWGKNDAQQVRYLESFLVSQGSTAIADGEYSSTEFEAVKEFQETHRADILDPWKIATPTGYVFTTTIKKMKEIGCK